MDKKLKIKFSAPLNPGDTENQTYGCRVNPDICSFCDMEKVCAFVREDHICKHPSTKWPKQYAKLKDLENKETD